MFYYVLQAILVRKGSRPGLGKKIDGDGAASSFGFKYNDELLQQNQELKEKVSAFTEERLGSTQEELSTTKSQVYPEF